MKMIYNRLVMVAALLSLSGCAGGQMPRIPGVQVPGVSSPALASQVSPDAQQAYRIFNELGAASGVPLAPAARNQKASYSPQIAIAPKTVGRFLLPTYCMDSGLPAPKQGEKFVLTNTREFLSDDLLGIHKALLVNAAQTKGANDSLVQGLVWEIRKTYEGKSAQGALRLTQEQQRLLTEARPDAIQVLQQYQQRQALINEGTKLLNRALGQRASDAQRLLNTISNNEAVRDVQQTMARLEAMPVVGEIAGGAAGYTMIAPNVAARAFSTSGGASMVQVDIANASEQYYNFDPINYTAAPLRQVQKLGIQPNVLSTSSGSAGRPESVCQALRNKPAGIRYIDHFTRVVSSASDNAFPVPKSSIIENARSIALTRGDEGVQIFSDILCGF